MLKLVTLGHPLDTPTSAGIIYPSNIFEQGVSSGILKLDNGIPIVPSLECIDFDTCTIKDTRLIVGHIKHMRIYPDKSAMLGIELSEEHKVFKTIKDFNGIVVFGITSLHEKIVMQLIPVAGVLTN